MRKVETGIEPNPNRTNQTRTKFWKETNQTRTHVEKTYI